VSAAIKVSIGFDSGDKIKNLMLPTVEGYRLRSIVLHCINECGVTLQRASRVERKPRNVERKTLPVDRTCAYTRQGPIAQLLVYY
jgi:hypothetical protein